MRFAETGVNLEIDLTRGSIEKEETDPKLTELYLGGHGTNTKLLWDRVPPEVAPFSPDNLLIFGTGLLCGTPVPAANRTTVSTISPPTYLSAYPVMGGFWGPELKYAGYDKVIIRGKSPTWVYLWINNNKVEIRDASHLVGKGVRDTIELIKQELKQDRAQVACIGPAGENRVVMSSIETGKASASKGAGAIMGDKRLKAIAVRGTKDIVVARPAELFDYCTKMMNRWRERPEYRGRFSLSKGDVEEYESFHLNNFAWGNARERIRDYWNDERRKEWREAFQKYVSGRVGCYNCPSACVDVINYPGVPTYFLKCWSVHGYWMASKLDIDFELKMCGISHDYGLDSWSTPLVIAFALELYDAGILTDRDMAGMPADTAGRFEWILDRIVRREGIGDVLANGTYWAAREIGKGAEVYDHNSIKRLEQHPIKLGMLNYTYYLMWTTNEKAAITQIEGSYPQMPRPTREDREQFVRNWAEAPNERLKQHYLDWELRGHETVEAACEITDWNETMRYVDDALGLCSYWGGFGGQIGQRQPYHIHSIPKVVSLATGMAMDEAELWRIAHRNRTLLRAVNVRRGLRRADEQVPEDHYKHRDPAMETKLLDEYYRFKGWNNDGIPDRALDEYGLDQVREDLKRRGIL
ncbi:MAG: aldehyde dehydrogenase [Chloroflexi bacterium]|nr:aldehyde dehydrogenase [Chloroflexota bacterium]